MASPNPKIVQGISFGDRALLDAAKERAASLGLSLSNYIKLLIRNDLALRGPLSLSEDTVIYQQPEEDLRSHPKVAEDAAPYGDPRQDSGIN